MKTLQLLLVAAVVAAMTASTARAQVDHLQCHKVKDSQKFKSAVVALTAVQNDFQLPGDCTLKGKATEFCVPVDKTVVDQGDAPQGSIGPGQDLSNNDYICYKMKCPKTTVADTFATDQFGARTLEKIKSPQRICVPAEKLCPEDSSEACVMFSGDTACTSCCIAAGASCQDPCVAAGGCQDPVTTEACVAAINSVGCAEVCCP